MSTTLRDKESGISVTRHGLGFGEGVAVTLYKGAASITVRGRDLPRVLALIEELVCVHCGEMQREERCRCWDDT